MELRTKQNSFAVLSAVKLVSSGQYYNLRLRNIKTQLIHSYTGTYCQIISRFSESPPEAVEFTLGKYG